MEQQSDQFQLLSNEVIDLFFSYLDPISFLRLGITSTRLFGFIDLSNESWRQKYAQTYYLNEKELAFYTNVNWKVLFYNRHLKELLFIRRIEKELNKVEEARQERLQELAALIEKDTWAEKNSADYEEEQADVEADNELNSTGYFSFNEEAEKEFNRLFYGVSLDKDATSIGPANNNNVDVTPEKNATDVLPANNNNLPTDFFGSEDEDDFQFLEDEFEDEITDAEKTAFQDVLLFTRDGSEIKSYTPKYDPFYKILSNEPIENFEHIEAILIPIVRGLIRDCKELYEMVDVVVTFFAKYLKEYPQIAEYLDSDKLGPFLYLRQDLYPTIAMGALSLMIDTLTMDSSYHLHALRILMVIKELDIDIDAMGEELGLWDVVYGLIKKKYNFEISLLNEVDERCILWGLSSLLNESTNRLKYRSDATIRKIIIDLAKNQDNYGEMCQDFLNNFVRVLEWPGDDNEELTDLVGIYAAHQTTPEIALIALTKSAQNSDYARKFLAGNEEFVRSLADAIEQNSDVKQYCVPLYNLLTQK